MEPFIGQIILFAGNFAPRGWAFCDGQLLDIASHSALFSILGTTYGGNGRTNFALPELRGRVPVHPGNGPGLPPVALGEKAGNASTTLNINNMPSHTHTATSTLAVPCHVTDNGNSDDPSGNALGLSPEDIYSSAATDASLRALTGGVTLANTGNGTSFSNMQPFLGLNYIIALTGIFPSRS